MVKSAVALVDKSYYATLLPFSDPYTTLPIELKRQALLLTITAIHGTNFFLNGTISSKI